MTVGEALASSGIDPREARLLLAEAAGLSPAAVLAFPEKELPLEVEEQFLESTRRRHAGEPVAYLLGRKEFYGLELAVNPAVLIPRPETELLVEIALQKKPSTVLDLGTGSGAIALALRKHLAAGVTAVEASAASLAVARRNAEKHNLAVEFLHGEWFGPVGGRRFDMVVSNPPYVAEGDPHLEALRFEPRAALVSGADGLDAIREITRQAPAHLAAGGWLLLEHGLGQDEAVRALLAGWNDVQTWPDLAGIPRVTGGRR